VAAAAYNDVPPRTVTTTHTVRWRVVFASTHRVTVKMADAPPPYPCFYLFTLTRLASESDPPLPPSHHHKSPTDPSPYRHSPPCQRVLLSRVRACVCVCACVSVRENCRACVCGACVCVSLYVHSRMCVCNIGFYYCHQRHQPTSTLPSIRISVISPGKVCFVVFVVVVVALFSSGNDHTILTLVVRGHRAVSSLLRYRAFWAVTVTSGRASAPANVIRSDHVGLDARALTLLLLLSAAVPISVY